MWVDERLKALSEEYILAIDTETTGFNSFKEDELFSIIISGKKDSFYFNFLEYPDQPHIKVETEETLEELKKFLDQPSKIWFLQNAKFDMHMLYKKGLKISGTIHELMALDRLYFNQHLSYNLAEISKRWGEEKLDIVKKYIDENPEICKEQFYDEKYDKVVDKIYFHKVPYHIISDYAKQDAKATLDVGFKLMDTLEKRQQDKFRSEFEVVKNESKLVKTLWKMENLGVRVDIEYCNEALEFYRSELNKVLAQFKSEAGMDLVKGTNTFEKIFESEKHKWVKTEKGNWKWDSDTLRSFTNPLAKLVIKYSEAKKQFEYFANILSEVGNDGCIHPSFKQAGTVTGRLSSSNPNCLSLDTEILTRQGWKDYKNIKLTDEVASYNKTTGKIEWQAPTQIYLSPNQKHHMVEYSNEHIHWRMTTNHRIITEDRKTGKKKVYSAINLLKDCYVLHSAIISTSLTKQKADAFIKLIVAIQADAYKTKFRYHFTFHKIRKVIRLLDILKTLNISYYYHEYNRGGKTVYTFSIPIIKTSLLDESKCFTYEILNYSYEQLVVFMEELKFWDGLSTRKNFDYCSNFIQNIDVVQAVSSLIGYRAHIYRHSNKKAWVITIVRRHYSSTANVKREVTSSIERVWCIQLSNSFFVARRGGDTFITGNCQNLTNPDKYTADSLASRYPVRRAFIPREGHSFFMIDYSQMEFRMMLDLAGAKSLIKEVLGGHDVHTATANLAKISRKEAKTCIAIDSLVLTNEGLMPIQDVELKHKLWDGVEWVNHDGVVFQGYKDTIEIEGLEATEDHYVYTDRGWKIQIGDYTKEHSVGRIMVTESKGKEHRYSFTHTRDFSESRPQTQIETYSFIYLFSMFKKAKGKFRKYSSWINKNLPLYDYTRKALVKVRSTSCEIFKRQIQILLSKMQQSKLCRVSELWWERDQASFIYAGVGGILPSKLYYRADNESRDRSNRQRQKLHFRQYAFSVCKKEPSEQENNSDIYLQRPANSLYGVMELFKRRLSRIQFKQNEDNKTCLSTSTYRKHFTKKSKRPVFDILNAGPRSRFTVSGKLVSNCNFLIAYGGGVSKLAMNLYDVTANQKQLTAIYKDMFGWRKSYEEQEAFKTVTREMRIENEPFIQAAHNIRTAIFNSAPEIKYLLKEVPRIAESRGFIFNWFGRRYQFPDKQFCYRAPNHLIQGGAADVVKVAMNRIDDMISNHETNMLLQVHDEIVFEVPYGEEKYVKYYKEIMEGVYPHKSLPLVAEVEYSTKNLADKEEWNESPLRGEETGNSI